MKNKTIKKARVVSGKIVCDNVDNRSTVVSPKKIKIEKSKKLIVLFDNSDIIYSIAIKKTNILKDCI